MKVAVDTNVLVYAEGLDGPERQGRVLNILSGLPAETRGVPVNVLGELFNVLTRKAQAGPAEARRRLSIWAEWGELWPSTGSAMTAAIDLASDHRLAIWDALVLTVAAEAGCRLVLSEDMQDGFTWRGATVVNPLAPVLSPLLASALRP